MTISKVDDKDLLDGGGNCIQYLIITCNGKGSEKEHDIDTFFYIFSI